MISSEQKTIAEHTPVMVSEAVSNLVTDPNGIYIDGTIGLGGHAKAILNSLNNTGKLIGLDRDNGALKISRNNLISHGPNVELRHSSYSQIDKILNELGLNRISGILLDLGLSSAQLADTQRGFSYDSSGDLDMRFDEQSGISVADYLESHNEEEIADTIWNFGEDRYSRKIARNIKQSSNLQTVDDLCEAIRRSTPPKNRNRSFARVFQALRIVVNEELQHLNTFLQKFIQLLTIGGRIVIISYHSLEDRLVKVTFKRYNEENKLNILTKKPLIASPSEVESNSRAKSAKMRIGERIA